MYIGEISSGKLSIVNVVIGEKIFFIGIEVIIIKVCRVRYFEELIFVIWDEDDEDYKDWIFFDNII